MKPSLDIQTRVWWSFCGLSKTISYLTGMVHSANTQLQKFYDTCISFRLSTRWKNAKAYVIAVSQVLAAPCIIGVLLAPTPQVSYGLLFLAYVTAETWLGPAAAIVQVNRKMRLIHSPFFPLFTSSSFLSCSLALPLSLIIDLHYLPLLFSMPPLLHFLLY